MQMAQLMTQQNIAGMGAGMQQSLANAGFQQQAGLAGADQQMQGLLANYQGQLQQMGLGSQMIAQIMDDLSRRLGINVNKNLGYAELDNQMRMKMYELEQRRWEMANQPKPGLFGKIMGAVGPLAGLALAPFTGGLSIPIGAAAGGAGQSYGGFGDSAWST